MTTIIDILNKPTGTMVSLPGAVEICLEDHLAKRVLEYLANENLTVSESITVIENTLFWLIYASSVTTTFSMENLK